MQYVRLGEVIHSAKSARCGDDDYPVLSITKSEGIILQSDKFKKRIASQDTSLYKIVCRGQLVQGIHIDEANFGIQDIVDAGIVSPAYKIWDVNSDRIIPKYLEEVLRSPRSIQYYASNFNGSIKRRERLTDKDFLAMEIPCPSLEEQDYTLSVIRKMRHILFYRRKEISAMDDLIKARFVEMFGDPIHNDKGWKTETVDSVCKEIYGGGTPSKAHPEYYEMGNIPWVSSKDMKTDVLTDSQVYINQLGVDNSTARMVPVNSIIMVIRSGILKHTLPVAINAVPVTVNQDLKVFIPSERMLARFMAVQFKMQEKDILSGVRAVTADNIEFNSLKNRKLIVPPIDLQNEYAVFMKQVDKSKVAVQAALDKAQLLFDSLMQQYFG